ncbi:MAG: PstS family phosphate ABC transporter substrate-binding protein [Aggregatilineales bacterium]
MKHSLTRGIGTAAVLAVLAASGAFALAQSGIGPITVIGSGIAGPVFKAAASEAGIGVEFTVTGTNSGFARFCAGEADATTATRAITADENAACISGDIAYLELTIGHDAIAFITNAETAPATCLTLEQISAAFAPSVEETASRWDQVIEDGSELQLSVYIPDSSTSTYAVLDRIVEGDGIRADAATLAASSEIVAAVSSTPGALGVVPAPSAQSADESVKVLDVDSGFGCRPPDAESIEGGLYAAADTLYVYANLASLQKSGLKEALSFAGSNEAAQIISGQGFLPPTDSAYAANQENLLAAARGETVVRAVGDAAIPTNLTGQISIGGASSARGFVQASVDSFKTLNPAIIANTRFLGEPAGFRQFCNGEINILAANNEPSPEQLDNCAANGIEPVAVQLGRQAAVLLAHSADDYLACLTTDQLLAVWSSQSSTDLNLWSQIDPSFPDTAITLFEPRPGSVLTDLLLLSLADTSLIARPDTEQNDDPLYRAAATANVDGALALVSWPEYQRVLANNQSGVQLLAVDAGNGCVTPSLSTISDGTYPLTLPTQLIVNQSALLLPEVQAFVLFLTSSDNFSNIEAQGFVGLRPSDLATARDRIQRAVLVAEAEAAAQAEATPEPSAEVNDVPASENSAERDSTPEPGS